jgi:hypothetical protein
MGYIGRDQRSLALPVMLGQVVDEYSLVLGHPLFRGSDRFARGVAPLHVCEMDSRTKT